MNGRVHRHSMHRERRLEVTGTNTPDRCRWTDWIVGWPGLTGGPSERVETVSSDLELSMIAEGCRVVLIKRSMLPATVVSRKMSELEVDLEKQEIRRQNGKPAIPFTVDPFRRHCLLNGLDDIALTLQKAGKIEEFEHQRSERWPWLDGFGYKGTKIPVAVEKKAKMEW